MTAEDDPEAFLESFERVAVASGMNKSKWMGKVGVLLGPGQAASQALSGLEAQDYGHLKEQILYRVDITPE